jgi:hypothetical protein
MVYFLDPAEDVRNPLTNTIQYNTLLLYPFVKILQQIVIINLTTSILNCFLPRNSLKDEIFAHVYSLRLCYSIYSYLVSTVRQKTCSAWDEIIGFQKERHLRRRL